MLGVRCKDIENLLSLVGITSSVIQCRLCVCLGTSEGYCLPDLGVLLTAGPDRDATRPSSVQIEKLQSSSALNCLTMRVILQPSADHWKRRWITGGCAGLITLRAGVRCVPLLGSGVLARTWS